MSMHQATPARRRVRVAQMAGLLAAGALAGGVLAATQGANAATTAATTAPSYGAAAQPHQHGPAPVRSDEKALRSADAATIRAAAVKAVPGGTVYRVETDAGDGAYEAHMTKADGSEVTVKFDKNLAVTRVEAGMGLGDPAPSGQHGPGPGGTGRGVPGGTSTQGSTGAPSGN